MSNQKYTPSEGELNEAITVVLEKKSSQAWDDVYSALVKEHPTWRLPERRVAKFVKRQKSVTASDEQSVRSMGSVRRSWMKLRKSRRESASLPIKNPEAPAEPALPQNETEASTVATPAPAKETKEAIPDAADKTEENEEKETEEKVTEEEKVETQVETKAEEEVTPEADVQKTRGDISLDLTPKTDEGALCEGCLIL